MKSVTINTLKALKAQGQKFPVVTSYDASFASVVEEAGIEVLLVGDSLGDVIQGQGSTVPVTIDDMVYHTKAVCRGNSKSLIVADLPFMAYAVEEQAMENAARLLQAGAHVVKLEGGIWLEDTVAMLAERGVPVCGHLGLTPQSVNKMGGYRVQGKDEEAAEQMLSEARILEEAGLDLLVLECVPSALAKRITEALEIPVIGIGAGPDTDAQVLVIYDMLGISPRQPKFTKNFLTGAEGILQALQIYAEEVRSGAFPTAEHSYN